VSAAHSGWTRSRRAAVSGTLLGVSFLELVVLVALTGALAALFARGIDGNAVYDEGVYAASADALAHGQKLGSDVFASQPPGFYLLLEGERFLFGTSVEAMRVGMLLLAVAGCLAAYYVGRSIAGLAAGALAMALVAVPLSVEDEAVRLRADFPSVSLSLLAIACTRVAASRRGAFAVAAAVIGGVALAAAVSVKLLAATAVVPVLAIALLRARRLLPALAAGAAAVLLAIVGAYAGLLDALWNGAVDFHLEAQSRQIEGAPTSLGGNATRIEQVLTGSAGLRSPFFWLVLAGAVGTALAWRRRRLADAGPLWLWALVSFAFLAWHRPLWAHDIVMLSAALAVSAGIGLAALLAQPRLIARAVAGVCAIVIAATVAHHLGRSVPDEDGGVAWAAAVLRANTPPGSRVVSDVPIVPYLADRRQPGSLIDTSRTRLESGWLTPAEILEHIDHDPLSAVVIGHGFASMPRVVRATRARFPFSLRHAKLTIAGERSRPVRVYLARPPRP
jgi:4-amino-4-deoxy-L-arabinose transferase-like glycosyltransferase